MSRALPPLLLAAALLGGCGSEAGGDGAGPGRDGASVAATEVALVSATAVGGEVGGLVELGDADDVAAFADQFEGPQMQQRLARVVAQADVAEGSVLVGAVVAIGCDVPPGVTVVDGEDGLRLVPLKVERPLKECLAPVTTVALVTVDEDL